MVRARRCRQSQRLRSSGARRRTGAHLSYFEPETKERYIPFVIEPAVSVERLALAFLVDAYAEEEAPTASRQDEKTCAAAPRQTGASTKVAVLPLSKHADLGPPAYKLAADIRSELVTDLDLAGSIGRRYRRQDEVGTPFCVTVDFDTFTDNQVTVRERDSMDRTAYRSEGVTTYLKDRFASILTGRVTLNGMAPAPHAAVEIHNSEGDVLDADAGRPVGHLRVPSDRRHVVVEGVGRSGSSGARRGAIGGERHSLGYRSSRTRRGLKMSKWVHDFSEGDASQKNLLGGKGANLAEMTNLGLPVPPGFTITTEACNAYREANQNFPNGLLDEVAEHRKKLEETMGRQIGDPRDPLLVSVRSGAPFSMPGMMDTVLNVGLNDESVEGLTSQTGSDRFAWDSYRRLLQMFGKTVLGLDGDLFEEEIEAAKNRKKVQNDVDLGTKELKALVKAFKKIIRKGTGRDFPRGSDQSADPRDRSGVSLVGQPELRTTGAGTRSRILSGRPSTFKRWCSATRAQDSGTGWLSRGTRRQGSRALWRLSGECPGRGRGCRDPQHLEIGGDGQGAGWALGPSSSGTWPRSSTTTRTCATSSSRSNRASCGCCRPG